VDVIYACLNISAVGKV
jgi:hypothetical protein